MKNFVMKNWKQIILFLVITSVIVYLIFYFFNLFNFMFSSSQTSECHEIYGYFGSYIGGILGVIIGFVTLFFVYLTYTSQRKELKLQKILITQQQFETTFFNMLNVHRELKKEFKLNINKRISNYSPIKEENRYSVIEDVIQPTTSVNINDFFGTEVLNFIRVEFEILYKSFKDLNNSQSSQTFGNNIISHEITENLKNNKHVLNNSEKGILELIFQIIFKNYRDILSHYFRNIYHILKFITENEIQNKLDYQKYADILQSQLNDDELFLLFYNFIVFEDESKKEFSTINICNNYHFLENLGHENLLNNDLHNNKKFYNFDVK